MTSSAILIPARYNSTRFPGKPLTLLDGVPMIKRVYNACKATGLPTYVLTDDMRIFEQFGARACWIDQENDYENGTARCAGAVSNTMFTKYLGHYNQFINVQGDMPDVTPEMIEKCIFGLKHYPLATVCTPIKDERLDDPNTVKLVRAGDKVLWMGRGMSGYGDQHLGVYGYKREALDLYDTLVSTREERIEKLEQLRWLKSGWSMSVFPVEFNGIEINTPQDAEKWNESR